MTPNSSATFLWIFTALVNGCFGCGGTKTGSHGTITSPNYPSRYHGNADCHWKIIAPFWNNMRLTFHDFTLQERKEGECNDFINIVEKGKSLMKKRGSAATFAVTSDSNVLSVHFHSDDCTTAKGFAMSWSAHLKHRRPKLTLKSTLLTNTTTQPEETRPPHRPSITALNNIQSTTTDVPTKTLSIISTDSTESDTAKCFRPETEKKRENVWTETTNEVLVITAVVLSAMLNFFLLGMLLTRQRQQGTILACNLPNIQEDLQEMKLLLKSQYELLESPGEIGDYDTVYPYRRRRLSQQGATEFAEYQDVSKV